MRRSRYSWLVIALFVVLGTTVASFAQGTAAPKQPAKAKPAARPGPRAVEPKPPAQRSSEPEVLTNDSVIKMVSGGVDEDIVIHKINSSAAAFTLDADSLIRLKSANVPPKVVRAMLNWKAPGTAAPAAPAVLSAAPEPVAVNIVKDPVPTLPSAPPTQAPGGDAARTGFLAWDFRVLP